MRDEASDVLQLDPAGKRALLTQLLRAAKPSPVPLSSGQRRLWLLDRIEPGASTYNVPFAFALRGELDRPALERALREVARRHAVLRSVVEIAGGEPVHVVDASFELSLPVVDVSGAAADSGSLGDVLAAESARPFDLAAAPAVRALLARVAPGEHVLLVTMHHSVTDGWSTAIFKRELGALYDAYHRGEASPLRENANGYAAFAKWQRERFSEALLVERLGYWKQRALDTQPLEWRERGTQVRTSRGRAESRQLASATRDALHALARTQRATLFTTLLTAFVVLLRRYTGQRDITLGTAMANRTRSEFEDTFGFFVNTLPLRTRIEGDPTFAELLSRVHGETLEAFDTEIPFETLVEAVHPSRSASRTPLVDAMFVLQNAPDDALRFSGLDVSPVPLERTTAKFDLTLAIVETAEGLDMTIEYRCDLFSAAAVASMLEAYEMLLGEIARDPNRPISQLPLLSETARHTQLVTWNDTARPLSGLRLEQLFDRRADEVPDNVALASGSERVSYGALRERANRLAHQLSSLGVVRGARVGLCVERGIDLVVGILAILKAGAAYVPLDRDFPRERLRLMIADTNAELVLTQRRFASRLQSADVRTYVMDDAGAPLERYSAQSPPLVGESNDAAYVMYTSGSTGVPKGVVIPHRAIERLACEPDYVRISSDDAVAQASTASFDASTFEIWGALLAGARLVIVPKPVLLAPTALAAFIADNKITIMFVTTALFREIVRRAPHTFGALGYLVIGGEVLTPEPLERLFDGSPPAHIINGYGPTEATTFAATHAIETSPGAGAVPIGRPISNTQLYVLDESHQLLPAGATGQLFIGGPGLALEYLNDAELTACKFVSHPFARGDEKLYATGDLARFLPNGELEYVGRMDEQLKIRGFRVEPAEIEAVLRAWPGVNDALVLAREDAAGHSRLVAYIAVGATSFASAALEEALRDRLPAHMLPDTIVPLPEFALTRSGKIDRGALPAPQARTRVSGGVTRSRDELERQLTVLWEALLGVKPIGANEDFFALGGHSLLAVRLIGEIERVFHTRLPLGVLFERPTIAHLACVLREAPASLNRSPLVTLRAGGAEAPFFYLHGSFEGGGYYCLGLAERLGADRPFHVMRPHGAGGKDVPASIEAMAADYLPLVLAMQPQGPYLLGGFCNGAFVALELARQLRQRGESVSNVLLVDTPRIAHSMRLVVAGIDRCGKLIGIDSAERTPVGRQLVRIAFRARRFIRNSLERSFVSDTVPRITAGIASALSFGTSRLRAEATRERSAYDRWRRITEAYVPWRYDGRITVFVTRDGGERAIRAAHAGWSRVADRIDVRVLPGDHHTCITDFIDETAQELAAALASR